MKRKIQLPLTRELAKTLRAGDEVLLSGTIYTSRDAGHKRMCETLARGESLPFDPENATIYYVGPTPAKPGQVIGSAGPTTSGRMDAYAPTLMAESIHSSYNHFDNFTHLTDFSIRKNCLQRQFFRLFKFIQSSQCLFPFVIGLIKLFLNGRQLFLQRPQLIKVSGNFRICHFILNLSLLIF